MNADEARIEEQVVPSDGQPQEVQRSLFGVLAGDVNTVGTAVATAYVIKKILSGGDDGHKDGGGQDPSPPEAGPPT